MERTGQERGEVLYYNQILVNMMVGRDWYLVEEVEVGRTGQESGEVFYVLLFWYHNPILVKWMVGRD